MAPGIQDKGASGKKFRNEGKNWEKRLKKNFLKVICKNNIEIKVKFEETTKKMALEIFGDEHPRPFARHWTDPP